MTVRMNEITEEFHKHIRLISIRNALMGAAIGNALGYAVETGRCTDIDHRPEIREFRDAELDGKTQKAALSRDFQEMMHVLEEMIAGYAQEDASGTAPDDMAFIQRGIERGRDGFHPVTKPESGCMLRMIPIALLAYNRGGVKEIAALGSRAAAVTHSHFKSCRYAAAFAYILAYKAKGIRNRAGLYGALWKCADDMKQLFGGRWTMNTRQLHRRLNAMRDESKPAAMMNVNPGARNAFYISLACCLRYPLDFARAITGAARHGSVVGAMTGCLWMLNNGIMQPEESWLEKLEMADEIAGLSRRMIECAERMQGMPLPEVKKMIQREDETDE